LSQNRNDVESVTRNAYKGNQSISDNNYGPIPVTLGQTYYWRIDQLDKAGVARWRGDVWHFTVETGRAEDPVPRDRVAAVKIDTCELSWRPGKYATSQKLYFGTSFDKVNESTVAAIEKLASDVTKCRVPVDKLEYGRRYYWRVDQINGDLPTSKGKVWSFRTADKVVYNDVTFFVCSDTHYGMTYTIQNANRTAIDNMNWLPGTEYPAAVGGGIVHSPRGVVVCGDLTDGKSEQWSQFMEDYGVNGEGRLAYPVYEGLGNHDGPVGGPVREGIKKRNSQRRGLTNISNNGLHYSWDWDDVHLVQLNIYAGDIRDKQVGRDFRSRIDMGKENEPEFSLSFLIEDLAENVGDSGRRWCFSNITAGMITVPSGTGGQKENGQLFTMQSKTTI